MHTHGCGLTLSVVVFVLVLVHPAPARQIPPGYDLRTDARVSRALLVNSRPGSGGATALMRRSLTEVRPFFDGQLRLLGAIRYANDQRLELLFRAIVRGSMVQGPGVATAETFAQNLAVLMRIGGSGKTAGRVYWKRLADAMSTLGEPGEI